MLGLQGRGSSWPGHQQAWLTSPGVPGGNRAGHEGSVPPQGTAPPGAPAVTPRTLVVALGTGAVPPGLPLPGRRRQPAACGRPAMGIRTTRVCAWARPASGPSPPPGPARIARACTHVQRASRSSSLTCFRPGASWARTRAIHGPAPARTKAIRGPAPARTKVIHGPLVDRTRAIGDGRAGGLVIGDGRRGCEIEVWHWSLPQGRRVRSSRAGPGAAP